MTNRLTDRPGKYILRIEPAQAADLHLTTPELKTLRILPNSQFVNGIDVTFRLPSDNRLELKPSLTSIKEKSELNFVILGAYALEQSYEPVLAQLKQLQLPYVKNQFSRVMKIYRIQTQIEKSEHAESIKKTLKDYGYQFYEQEYNNRLTLFVGPYYSAAAATEVTGILSAAFDKLNFKLATNNESIDMTEIAVGGFSTTALANEFAAKLKKFNFSEVSVQKRSTSQWSE